ADHRRCGLSLRRADRRRRVQAAVCGPVRADAAVLAVLDRTAAGRHRAGRARPHRGLDRPGAPAGGAGGLASPAPPCARGRRGAAMTIVLETEQLEKRFGGLLATNKVSLRVEKGARHALIGPNGAGKTTLINLLTGVLRPTSGSIRLDGRDITATSQHA